MNIKYIDNTVIFSGKCPDGLHIKDYLNETINTIRFENFDTSEVVDMSYMFFACSVKYIEGLEQFDTSHVENMSSMFARCSCIERYDSIINNWDVRNVKDMIKTFGMNSISHISLPKWETPMLENCTEMFSECPDLVSVNLYNFGCSSHLKYAACVFCDSEALQFLMMPKICISKSTEVYYFFHDTAKYENNTLSVSGKIQRMYTDALLGLTSSEQGADTIANHTNTDVDGCLP